MTLGRRPPTTRWGWFWYIVNELAMLWLLFCIGAALLVWPLSWYMGWPFVVTAVASGTGAMLICLAVVHGRRFVLDLFLARRIRRTPCGACGELPGPSAVLHWSGGDVFVECRGCNGCHSLPRPWA